MLVITPRTPQACKMSILEGGERFATYVNITVANENLSLMYPIMVLWVTPMGITPYNVGSPGGVTTYYLPNLATMVYFDTFEMAYKHIVIETL